MEGTYDVKLADVTMGSATLKRDGLYWIVQCRCALGGEVMYDLTVSVGDHHEKLGLLIPEDSYHTLTTKVAVKRLGQGKPAFSLLPRHGSVRGQFVAVKPDEPFSYLNRLERAYLAIRDGQPGIVLQDEKI